MTGTSDWERGGELLILLTVVLIIIRNVKIYKQVGQLCAKFVIVYVCLIFVPAMMF